jgi:hypothetical protein
LDKVFKDIKDALARSSSGGKFHSGQSGDRYLSGDVNWDGYDLPTLVAMVASPADPGQVDTVAGLWRSNGALITQSAENLSQSLTTLLQYWHGSAAEQASAAVTNTANWVTAVGETAAKLADSVEDAGGALRSAQSTMPSLASVVAPAVGFNPAAGAALAAAAGGPMGVASGALVGGLTSMFDAGAGSTATKQQAVQTMQRYEQAATTIDTNTPQFTAPVAWTGDSGTTGTTGGTGVAGGVGVGSLTTATSSAAGSGNVGQGFNQGTVPSFADNAVGRWNALTGGGRLGGIGGGGAGSFLGGMFGAGGTADGTEGAASRQKAGAANSSAVTNETGGVAARGGSSAAGILEDVGGKGAAGGMPIAGGMGAPGARGGGSEADHRRRIPFEEEPFTTGLKAVPPVIGLNPTD